MAQSARQLIIIVLGSKGLHHLTVEGADATLCGHALPNPVSVSLVLQPVCRRCERAAYKRKLTCPSCGNLLFRAYGEGLCWSCFKRTLRVSDNELEP
jgi:hypothetical protein